MRIALSPGMQTFRTDVRYALRAYRRAPAFFGLVTGILVLGIGISAFLKRFPLIHLPADVYYVDRLPIRLTGSMIESVAGCAFLLVILSILYPAWKAQQMDPVQAIRYG